MNASFSKNSLFYQRTSLISNSAEFNNEQKVKTRKSSQEIANQTSIMEQIKSW